MSCFFHYPPCAIAARFDHGKYDYVYLSLRVVDYGVITGIADEALCKIEIEEPVPTIHRLKLRMSAGLNPIPDMIAWLEAPTCRVQSATWLFDGEGLHYELTSTFNQLVLVENEEERLRVTMAREKLIPGVYCALRRFGESRRYRPEDWEGWGGSRATPLGAIRSSLVESYINRLYLAPQPPRWDRWAIPPWLRQ